MTIEAMVERVEQDEFQSRYVSNHWAAGPTGAPRRELKAAFDAGIHDERERYAAMTERELMTLHDWANRRAARYYNADHLLWAALIDVTGFIELEFDRRRRAGQIETGA